MTYCHHDLENYCCHFALLESWGAVGRNVAFCASRTVWSTQHLATEVTHFLVSPSKPCLALGMSTGEPYSLKVGICVRVGDILVRVSQHSQSPVTRC